MNYYGYIYNSTLFEKQDEDVVWNFTRYNSNGKIENFDGVESVRQIPNSQGVITLGDKNQFKDWLNEVFLISPTITLNDTQEDTRWVLESIDFHSKVSRNLNTAVDVYFTFEEEVYGVRFQDWNIFRTLTDEQCEEKLRKYLIENSEIKHPAKPLEQ